MRKDADNGTTVETCLYLCLCLGPESGPNPNACRNPVFVCAGASSVPLEREARRKRQLSCHLFGFINIFGLLRTTLESRVENWIAGKATRLESARQSKTNYECYNLLSPSQERDMLMDLSLPYLWQRATNCCTWPSSVAQPFHDGIELSPKASLQSIE